MKKKQIIDPLTELKIYNTWFITGDSYSKLAKDFGITIWTVKWIIEKHFKKRNDKKNNDELLL